MFNREDRFLRRLFRIIERELPRQYLPSRIDDLRVHSLTVMNDLEGSTTVSIELRRPHPPHVLPVVTPVLTETEQ